jgi:hypothetical protein
MSGKERQSVRWLTTWRRLLCTSSVPATLSGRWSARRASEGVPRLRVGLTSGRQASNDPDHLLRLHPGRCSFVLRRRFLAVRSSLRRIIANSPLTSNHICRYTNRGRGKASFRCRTSYNAVKHAVRVAKVRRLRTVVELPTPAGLTNLKLVTA